MCGGFGTSRRRAADGARARERRAHARDDAAAAAGIHTECHETLYGILMEWADAQPDAVPWNKWQQEVNKIASKKVPGYRDTFNAPGHNWTKYVKELWAEIMEVFHGPDWRVKAKEAEKKAKKAREDAEGDVRQPGHLVVNDACKRLKRRCRRRRL